MSTSDAEAMRGRDDVLRRLASRYSRAWNDHDLEAVLALHTPDTVHRLHGAGGVREWSGIDACREVFTYLLQAWPDQRFDTRDLALGRDMYVATHLLTGTLAQSWPMGGRTFEPTGMPISFEIVDVMRCVGGRIHVKEVWIDGLAIAAQLDRGDPGAARYAERTTGLPAHQPASATLG